MARIDWTFRGGVGDDEDWYIWKYGFKTRLLAMARSFIILGETVFKNNAII
jgi:hypothetical protein